MKLRTLIIRELSDAALAGRRHWASLTELAHATGASIGLTHRVVRELEQKGVTRSSAVGNGFDLTSPEKAVTLVAATRNVARESRRLVNFDTAEKLASGSTPSAIGGMDAAVHHLGGVNTVAAIGAPRILYLPADVLATTAADGSDVALLELDHIGAHSWATETGFASWTQTYGDLFGLPGWQAEEFRRAMFKSAFAVDDWEILSA